MKTPCSFLKMKKVMKSMAGLVAGHHHWMHQVMQSAAGGCALWTTASRGVKPPSQYLQCLAWLAGHFLLPLQCWLPFLPGASCLLLPVEEYRALQIKLKTVLLNGDRPISSFPACCLLPCLPVACCLSCVLLAAFPAYVRTILKPPSV